MMKRVDDFYIGIGLVWLIAGMVMGAWMGLAGQFQFTNTHAHMNLVGFVISVAFGLIYRAYPTMRMSRFAWPQLALYEIGAILLVSGKAILDSGGDATPVKIGTVVIVLGVVAMLALFALRRREPAGSPQFLQPTAPR